MSALLIVFLAGFSEQRPRRYSVDHADLRQCSVLRQGARAGRNVCGEASGGREKQGGQGGEGGFWSWFERHGTSTTVRTSICDCTARVSDRLPLLLLVRSHCTRSKAMAVTGAASLCEMLSTPSMTSFRSSKRTARLQSRFCLP